METVEWEDVLDELVEEVGWGRAGLAGAAAKASYCLFEKSTARGVGLAFAWGSVGYGLDDDVLYGLMSGAGVRGYTDLVRACQQEVQRRHSSRFYRMSSTARRWAVLQLEHALLR